MENVKAASIEWTQKLSEVSGSRYVEVADAYETYYATIPANMTEDEAVDAFVGSYDYDDEGTEEALRAEIQSELFS